MSQFMVEHPEDEYGNTAGPYCVIEVEEEPVVINGKDMGWTHYRVIAPAEVAAKWPTLRLGDHEPCDGPARMLTRDELEELWKQLGLTYPPHQIY